MGRGKRAKMNKRNNYKINSFNNSTYITHFTLCKTEDIADTKCSFLTTMTTFVIFHLMNVDYIH